MAGRINNTESSDNGMLKVTEACAESPRMPAPHSASLVNGAAHADTLLLEIQRDLALGLLPCRNLAECLDQLLSAAMRLPGFDCCGVYLHDELTGGLELILHRGLSEDFVGMVSFYPADSPQARLVGAGEMVYALRADLPAEVAGAIRSEGLEALAILPLRDQTRVIAALHVSSHHYPAIERASRLTLESLVAQAEVAIAAIRERQAHLLAERQLTLAAEGAELGTWMADFSTGKFTHTGKSNELHGLPPDLELTTESAMFPIHPEDQEKVREGLQRAMESDSQFSCEYRVSMADGGERWVSSKGRFFDEGNGKQLYGIVRDVTRKKLAEASLIEARDQLELRVAERTAELQAANEALREETKRLELALDASQAGTWVWQVWTENLVVDNRERRLYGFEDDVPVSFGEIVSRLLPEDRSVLLDRLLHATQPGEGEFWNIEFRIQHPVHGERWLGGMGRIERDDQGIARRMVGINFDITERKLTEQSLRESECKFRSLHESMSEAFASADLDGRFIETNSAFQEMTGYSQEELKDMTFMDITPEKWHSIEHRIATSEEFLTRGYTDVFEKEYRHKSGRVFPIELRAFMLRDSAGDPAMIWGIARDISDRKKAEQTMLEWNQTLEKRVAERTAELHRSEARFRQLAEATFEGIAISEGGILIDCNPQLARIHGYDTSEMIGRPVSDFVAPESLALVAKQQKEEIDATCECRGLRKDGTTFPVEVRACMITQQGREIRLTALRDLTEAKKAAARFQALHTELQHAQRLGLVSEVSAGIIHQLGQPLCAMGVNVAAALARLRSCDSHKCGSLQIVEDVEADIVRMREAVVHLRALANPGKPTRRRIDLNEMISDVIAILSQDASRRSIDIEVDFSPNLPLIEADSVQLSQVVLNLLHNAFDACSEITEDRRSVIVKTRVPEESGVEFVVSDSGTGIAREAMPDLFAPFFSTKSEGLGMGLRLSRTIVQAHGGSIEGSNNPSGLGAVFRVHLPLSPDIHPAKV